MFKLAAFADEISPDLSEQVRVCRENDVTHFELRSVNKINVLDLPPALRQEIKSRLADNGLAVAAIGSPIGKVKIDEPWETHFDRFKTAVELAEFFAAPMIRLFSYYPAQGGDDIHRHRDEVMRRMRAKVDYVQSHPGITLVHENEAKIYGEKGRDCLDLMQTIDSPRFRSAFDFANFVVCGEDPAPNWPILKPYTTHVHVKDAIMGTGRIVPAGEGDGKLAPILTDLHSSGYNGFLSLEPHLARHGQMGGFSGAELFKVAADALKKVCRENGLPLAGSK